MNEIGWQGGTIWQVCQALNCEAEDILYNGREKFDEIFERARNLQ